MPKETPHTTAHVLGVFAKELDALGFSESRVDSLLVVALQHELRTAELGLLLADLDV